MRKPFVHLGGFLSLVTFVTWLVLTPKVQPNKPQQMYRRTAIVNIAKIQQEDHDLSEHSALSEVANMSVEERMKYDADLLQHSPQQLFEIWLENQHSTDLLRREFIAGALTSVLATGNQDGEATVQDIQAYLLDTENSLDNRAQLLRVLGRCQNPIAFPILTHLSLNGPEDSRGLALTSVLTASERRPDGSFNEAIAPSLIQAWPLMTNSNQSGLFSLSLAKCGTPSAVRSLLDRILEGGQTVENFETMAPQKSWDAFDAMSSISNPIAIPTLQRILVESDVNSVAFVSASRGLAKMGDPQATAVLLDWVLNQGADTRIWIDEWIADVRDEASLRVVASVADRGIFKNEANRKQVREAFRKWQLDRTN